MGKTTIEWTNYTFNPWWGCVKVSEGCRGCYAERMATRFGFDVWGSDKARRFFDDKYWATPLKWNTEAERDGVRRRVFCGSMCDVFEAGDDALNGQRTRLWDLIERTPALDWLLLTKRPENIEGMLPEIWSCCGYWRVYEEYKPNPFPRNVWLGVTAENQGRFDERWPVLESVGRCWYVPVLFVSVEPMLGPVNIADYQVEFIEDIAVRGMDWVICGGESGPGARLMRPEWVRSLRDQCVKAEVPLFFKSWGEYVTLPQAGELGVKMSLIDVMNANSLGGGFVRVGKKRSGCAVDGLEWREGPVGDKVTG